MFNFFRKPAQENVKMSTQPESAEIGAVRAAELLGLSVPKLHQAIANKQLPVAVNVEQPVGAWRWRASEILALAAANPQGLTIREPKPPVRRQEATVTIGRAAEILMMPARQLEAIVDDPQSGAPRRVVNPAADAPVSNRIFVSRLYRWCEKHRARATARLDDWMREQHIAFDADGKIYTQERF